MQPPHLDVGEPSGRRRRDFFYNSVLLPLLFFVSTGFASSSIWLSAFVNLSAHASVSLRRKLAVVSRSSCMSLYGSSTTGPNFFWGIPQPVEFLAGYSRRSSSMLLACSALPSTRRVNAVLCSTSNSRGSPSNPWIYTPQSYPHGSAPHQPDPPPSIDCYLPRISMVLTTYSSIVVASVSTVNAPSQTNVYSRRHLGVEDGSCWVSCYGSVSGLRGIPLTVSPLFTSTHKPSPPPSPSGLVLSHKIMRLGLVDPTVPDDFSASLTVSQPMYLWGMLIILINFLKISGGFIGFFTETYLHTMPYLSFAKKLQPFHLPVDSSGISSLSLLASFSPEKRSILSPISFLRSVFPPNVKWRCMPMSIIVCLSCEAVCSGPEDATEFVSTIFRGADWVSTSHFKVTISQVSGTAVKLDFSTHSSFSLNSLSSYLRGFSTSMAYVVLSFVHRVCLNSVLICSPSI